MPSVMSLALKEVASFVNTETKIRWLYLHLSLGHKNVASLVSHILPAASPTGAALKFAPSGSKQTI